ncbi:Glycylpeptide N-tetradecanoyltransferase 1 [Camellia lanceoleosa]|uniref:Glycylpeptide N-tetradecanoyltransferase 1 n=1 Tax=Camellia lanceoleosa TaxID=1840588 RepID=A0ACC0F9D3_9ERIC|nr:Glycylpeptide N-tetradecanoyltransferase 1 [Camellia lanceoleosa]
MVDNNSTSNSPAESQTCNPDGNLPSESGVSIDSLARKVQESLLQRGTSFGKPNLLGSSRIWVTQRRGNEVYALLTNNYVEDDENMFRFNYSMGFLRWALRPPGFFKNWHIGVRVKSSKKLVAFITGVPARIRVRDTVVYMAEINFLCVHKKLRSKRLAPVMIKEVTRRVHLENMWQAAYTAGVVLPTPISTCQYWHRSLNPKKLIDVGFSRLGARMTMSRTIKLYKLPDSTATPGFRKMESHDVPAVTRLLRNYLSQFLVAPDFDENDVEHWLLPRENVG